MSAIPAYWSTGNSEFERADMEALKAENMRLWDMLEKSQAATRVS